MIVLFTKNASLLGKCKAQNINITRMHCSGGVSVQGGISVQGGLCQGSVSRGVFVQGVSVMGGLCPGGSVSRGISVQREVSIPGGVSVQGVSVRETLSGRGLCLGSLWDLCLRGLCVGGVSVQGGGLCLGSLFRGLSPPPPVNRITDACENITLPQLRCGQ